MNVTRPRRGLGIVSLLVVGLAALVLFAWTDRDAFAQSLGTLEVPVPYDWTLKPTDVGFNGRFRLIFITSGTSGANSSAIADYDIFVQSAVAEGHTDIQKYSSLFRAVVSASDEDARDHIGATGTGVQINWLNGNTAAANYSGFFDQSLSETSKDESGENAEGVSSYWTGSNDDGTKYQDQWVGSNTVRVGGINSGLNQVEGLLINHLPLLGMSPIFRVLRSETPYIVSLEITSVPEHDNYGAGDIIKVAVNFRRAVTVDVSGGTPYLALNVGENTRNADYSAAQSTDTSVVFTYEVAEDDKDDDGVSIDFGALTLNNATIKMRNGDADAHLFHFALADQSSHTVNTAPVLETATVDGASLVLTYNEALDEGSEPAAGAYAVKLAGAAGVAPSSAAVSGRTVTLTLAAAAGHGQTVTLSYTVPTGTDAKPVRDGAGERGGGVQQPGGDQQHPGHGGAGSGDGDGERERAGADLQRGAGRGLGAGGGCVRGEAGGRRRGLRPSAAAVSGRTVTLTLAAAAGHGQAVTLSYTVPTGTDAKPVRDGAENEAAAFSNRAVTNNTPDAAAPALETATVNGSALVLTYNEALDEGSEPAAGAYAVKLAGGAGVAPSAAAVSGRTVTLTLAAAAGHGQTVTLSYTVPTGTDAKPVRDGAENEAAAFSNRAVTNNTPDTAAPALETATVNGSALVLTYNEALDESSEPAAGAYAVKLAGAAGVAPSAAAVSGRTVTLTLAAAAGHGQTVTLSYTVPTGTDAKPVRDGAENEAAAFSDRTVTNNTPDTAAPALETATVNGSALVLTYNEALDEGLGAGGGCVRGEAGGRRPGLRRRRRR